MNFNRVDFDTVKNNIIIHNILKLLFIKFKSIEFDGIK